MFWTFRIMVGLGVVMLLLIGLAFYQSCKQKVDEKPWLLKGLLYALPFPWIAIMCGWFVAEYGRQPWTIAEVLPTYLSASSLSVGDLVLDEGGFNVLLGTTLSRRPDIRSPNALGPEPPKPLAKRSGHCDRSRYRTTSRWLDNRNA